MSPGFRSFEKTENFSLGSAHAFGPPCLHRLINDRAGRNDPMQLHYCNNGKAETFPKEKKTSVVELRLRTQVPILLGWCTPVCPLSR